MTDPTTLSAEALDALAPDDLTLIAELLRRDAAGAAGVYMSPSDVRHEAARLLDMLAAVLPMARRTEAAERERDREVELRRSAEGHNAQLIQAMDQIPYANEFDDMKARTEAAERKIQRVEALCEGPLAWTVNHNDIRRALAED